MKIENLYDIIKAKERIKNREREVRLKLENVKAHIVREDEKRADFEGNKTYKNNGEAILEKVENLKRRREAERFVIAFLPCFKWPMRIGLFFLLLYFLTKSPFFNSFL